MHIFKKYKFGLNLFTFEKQYKLRFENKKMHNFFGILNGCYNSNREYRYKKLKKFYFHNNCDLMVPV